MQKRRTDATRRNFNSRKTKFATIEGKEFYVIPNYTGYLISKDGSIYSIWKKKIMKQTVNKLYKYKTICLVDDFGKRKNEFVHRLVAKTFVVNPKPTEYLYVNHKDENKMNNNAENLEWCTHRYNDTYGTKIERSVKNNSEFYKKNRIAVLQFDKTGNYIRRFSKIADVSKYGYSAENVSRAVRGVRKTANGYIWRKDT